MSLYFYTSNSSAPTLSVPGLLGASILIYLGFKPSRTGSTSAKHVFDMMNRGLAISFLFKSPVEQCPFHNCLRSMEAIALASMREGDSKVYWLG